jgi:hypothetical protein
MHALVAVLLLLSGVEQSRTEHKEPGVFRTRPRLPLTYEPPLAKVSKLTIGLNKDVYQPGETANLSVAVTNTSEDSIACHCSLSTTMLEIEYRRTEEPFRSIRLVPQEGGLHGIWPLYELEPGESAGNTLWIAYDFGRNAAPFDKVGTYELRASFYDHPDRMAGSRLVSNAIQFEVTAPESQAAYLDYTPEIAKLVHLRGGGTPTDSLIRAAAGFLDRHGATVYAEPVSRALATMLQFVVYTDGIEGKTRSGVPDGYLALYERYRTKPAVRR